MGEGIHAEPYEGGTCPSSQNQEIAELNLVWPAAMILRIYLVD